MIRAILTGLDDPDVLGIGSLVAGGGAVATAGLYALFARTRGRNRFRSSFELGPPAAVGACRTRNARRVALSRLAVFYLLIRVGGDVAVLSPYNASRQSTIVAVGRHRFFSSTPLRSVRLRMPIMPPFMEELTGVAARLER
jgi:hypothetical protein